MDDIARILRYLASVGIVAQIEYDQYAATPITHTLTIPALAAGVAHT